MTSPAETQKEVERINRRNSRRSYKFGASIFLNELVDQYDELCEFFDTRRIDYTDGKRDFHRMLSKIHKQTLKLF